MEKTSKTPWTRKRKLSEKMERMRDAKRVKSSESTLPSPATDSLETTALEDVSQPSTSSSSLLQGTSEQHDSAASLDDSLRVPISMQFSEDDSSETESEDNFSNDDAQVIYEKWLQEKSKEDIKMIGVMFMDSLMARFNMTTHGAASEVGLVLHYNEKTVRTWRKDFYANRGQFSESKQGKHARSFILDDEDLRHQAAEWVRANSTVKGKPNMTGSKFCLWVNSHLLSDAELPPGCPQQIQTRTAIKWLHNLGFRPQSHKKSIYIDGHERSDVVEYRKLYLRKLQILSSTHLPPPPCDDGLISVQTGDPNASKHLMLIFHDESSFHANEGQSIMWAEEGRVPIRPKNQGRGLMISDFVTEFDGLLQLSLEEYRAAVKSDSSIRMCAREVVKFGSGSEGYWNNAKFLKQMERAVKIANRKYPSEKFTKVWIFDQSSGHCAYREDALNVNRMNVGSGGAQPPMRDTVWDGRTQRMVLADGKPKGMKIVLEERGIDTSGMKAADMRLVLGNHDDFKHEKTALEHYMQDQGQRAIYLPKFHCELNPIERVWGEAKRYTRSHCDYSFPGLERTVVPALESVKVSTIRKYFRKCREYMEAYREGNAGGNQVEKAVQRYKSHRRVFGTVQ